MDFSSADRQIARQYARRGRTATAHRSGRNGRYRFLNANFKSIPGYCLPVDEMFIQEKAYSLSVEPLRDNLLAFYHEFGIDAVPPELTGNFKPDLSALYNHLLGNLPDKDWGVELINDADDGSGPLRFVVYDEISDFPYDTVFSVPIKKMFSAEPTAKELLLMFFAFLHRNDMYVTPKEHYDFAYCCGQVENGFDHDKEGKPMFDDDIVECWDDEYKEWAQRYAFGDISSMMCGIVKKEQELGRDPGILYEGLNEAISSCRSNGNLDSELLNAIGELSDICLEGFLSDFHILTLQNVIGEDFMQESNPYNNEYMDFSRLFFFCYDSEDPICEKVMDCINADAYNIEIGMLYNYAVLGKDDVHERMSGTFPQRWTRATNKAIELLSDEQDNKVVKAGV